MKAAKKFARKRGWAVTVKRSVLDLYPHLTGDTDCHADLLTALNAVAEDLGVSIHIASGLRTLDEQKHLYALYLAGRGALAAVPNVNAPHIRGIAADCHINGGNMLAWNPKRVRAACEKHGVCFPVPGETWHASLTKDVGPLKWAN